MKILLWSALSLMAIMPSRLLAQETAPAPPAPEKPAGLSLTGSDGAPDISAFLSSRVGFLPLVVPITEPAIGFGLGIGLTFFHEKPPVVPGPNGTTRTIFPTTTAIFGATTENGTWATGLGHLHLWDEGRIRYMGAAGYASLNLDWYGKDNALQGRSISYNNKVLFIQQQVTFQLGDTFFYLGPSQRFLSTDASFEFTTLNSGISNRELQSQTSGLGLEFSYDSRDQPFSPTKGIRSSISYSQQAQMFGGDFDYGKLRAYGAMYTPLMDNVILGLYADGTFNIGDAPFYDLAMIKMRGIPIGRYVDNNAIQAEMEIRWDVTRRWSLVGFGGIGRVGHSVGDLLDADNHFAVGAGFRYLIAEQYGLRLGLDVAHADDDWAVYLTLGTGWLRP